MMVKVTRIAVVLFWIGMALRLVSVIPDAYGSLIVWIGGLVLIIHLLEYLGRASSARDCVHRQK